MVGGNVDFDESSTIDDIDCAVDIYDLSESSSSDGSEEQIEIEQMTDHSHMAGLKQDLFSVLSFSKISSENNSLQKPLQCEDPCHVNCFHGNCKIPHALGHFPHPHNEDMILCDASFLFKTGDSNQSLNSDFRSTASVELHSSEFGLQESKRIFGVQIGEFYGMVDTKQSETIPPIQSWKLKFSSNFFSMNPVLTKDSLLHVMRNNGNRCKRDSSETLSYHDFSSVEDPFRVCIKKLLARPREDLKNEPVDSNCAAIGCENGGYESGDSGEQGGDRGDILINKTESHYNHVETLTDVSGGSSWESLLGSSHKPVNDNALNHLSFTALFGMPLDFIIDKCLLQEIWLQYKYISKLTIKFLEEGFNFHEHLLALRRYHFMEVADWADLFIRSLWHQKWCMKVPDHRLSEIQGYLALSIQRSSCECDDNKNRLFVYVKEHSMMPLSRSVIGINSFEFLGLGYRVDWPISIILTPVALKIYADIFSFLIQVKLAAFALTDVWSSIKELAHFVGKNRHSEVHKWQAAHFDMFVKIRHQVNHFVCTLQHYVESHLSQESWCMFIQSIRHKVNDMMDLDSVHMAYLTDSLHICFLSEQTQLVGGIIKHILQCALDFRSCLAGGTWNVLLDQEDLLSKLSGINISQVLSIKQTFEKNLKELHFCYLKSPKHVNFGLSRFWELFNYNEYYNDVSDKTGCYGFLV